MKRAAKIDSINIRRSHFGLTGIVYSYGYAYAVRYAPDAIVIEALIRKSWREQRPAFRPYDDSTDTFVYTAGARFAPSAILCNPLFPSNFHPFS